MFILLGESNDKIKEERCLQVDISNKAEQWHHRYGHLNYKGLHTLCSKEMVVGLPEIGDVKTTCEACVKGKHHRVPFPKQSNWRATERLQLIHFDLYGPINPLSNTQIRYFVSFIEDFLRKTWIYFVLEKSEAFHQFKTFKAFVEKQTGLFIKCLRTDRGGEYNSNAFKEFCKEHGIKIQLTTAFTPQQNGVAERKNRTIMNIVRAALLEKEVPKAFWPDVVQWVNHVLNRSPTLIVKDMTSEEAWSGRKPLVEHFSVFGCIRYVHIPDVKRSKLDAKSVKYVLLGFKSESKAFKMFDPVEKKFHINRDVIFEEDKKWNWEDVGYSSEESIELEWENDYEDVENAEEAEEAEEYTDDVPSLNNPATGETISTTGRVRKPPILYADYITGEGLLDTEEEANMARVEIETLAFMVISDPTSFQEVVGHQKWKQAMDAEIQSIERNHTWSLTALPVEAKAIGVKWIYKIKLNELGEVDKFKARLVVKGYAQEYGVYYTEVFAPVARMDTVRMIIVVAAQRGWGIYQLDVKSAFLHGKVKEDVFVAQPQGYEVAGKKDMVYKLHKALYGLKQAPRAWFSRIEAYIFNEGFISSSSEQTLFIKQKGGKILIVSIYVDDLLFTSNDEELLNEFKRSMKDECDMTDLGKMRYFLGIEVMQKADGIFICQRKYVAELIERFGMQNNNSVCNPIVPGQKVGRDEAGVKVDSTLYKQMVGSLMYLTATRLDLMFVVSLISRFMTNPTE